MRIGGGLVAVAPHRGAHRVALRAAVSLAVPLLVLWAIGRLDLSVYACFGAFASLYGRFDDYGDRIRMQVAAASALVGAMLVGTLVSFAGAPVLVRIVVVAAVASVVTLVARAWRWHPPGALFAVFAAGACAAIPADGMSFAEVAVVGGAAAVFGILVTIALAAARGGLRLDSQPRRVPADRGAVVDAAVVGAGALLAGLAGLALVGDHWYWAMVAAVAAMSGPHVTARLVRGAQRLIGTLAGVLIAVALLALQLPPLAVIAVAVVCQAGAELFVNRNYGLAMLFVTPLALLMVELALPAEPGPLLVDRTLETVVGVVVGTAVVAVTAWAARRVRG